jgi:hypothetical protein
MTGVCLGVGCERKPKVLDVGPACKPLLLFRHRRRVRSEKSQSVESVVQYEIIQLPPRPLTLKFRFLAAHFRLVRSEDERNADISPTIQVLEFSFALRI